VIADYAYPERFDPWARIFEVDHVSRLSPADLRILSVSAAARWKVLAASTAPAQASDRVK
jgi:hypothetical protein